MLIELRGLGSSFLDIVWLMKETLVPAHYTPLYKFARFFAWAQTWSVTKQITRTKDI
jgi:hypothetical protein